MSEHRETHLVQPQLHTAVVYLIANKQRRLPKTQEPHLASTKDAIAVAK